MNLADGAYGVATEMLSRGCVVAPQLGKYVVGDHPDVTPVGYRLAQTQASDIDNWVEFAGDPEAGVLPKNYPTAGIVLANIRLFDQLCTDHPRSQPAVAWVLGKQAVLVGVVPESTQLTKTIDNYAAALRIGRGTLRATLGVFERNSRRLYTAVGSVQAGRTIDLSEPTAGSAKPSIPIF
jgi:hypothetical protein